MPGIPPGGTRPPAPLPKLVATPSSPPIERPSNGPSTSALTGSMACAYTWAYQDLPDLSATFQSALQELQPGAMGHAFAFGEECRQTDGTVPFLPMETDFDISLPVSDLVSGAELGDWTKRVMQVIESIPPEMILGPRPGRVSLLFEAGDQRTGGNFYIDQCQALAGNLDSAELFRMLQESQ